MCLRICCPIRRLVYKAVCTAMVMAFGTIALAQTEVPFFMEIDTAYNGVYVGQEYNLKYRCTVRFDSVSPPDFANLIEVIKGPVPNRQLSTIIVNGKKKQRMEEVFSYQVRFLREGVISLPIASVKAEGRVYITPPFHVRVKPAEQDIQGVVCSVTTQRSYIEEGETFFVTLTCNRRPDNLAPLLELGDSIYKPSGSSSRFSYTKGSGKDTSAFVNAKESYEFHYNIRSDGSGVYTFSAKNLTFGGIPYSLDNQVIKIAETRHSSPGGNNEVVIVLVIGCMLIFGFMWLRFHREADEELASFVLREGRLNLSTDWALTHYGFPLFLVSIPFFFLLSNLYKYFTEGRQDLFFPWFWCGLLPAFLAFAVYRNQRSKLNFRSVKISFSDEVMLEVVEETARENNWTIDHAGRDCVVAHTHSHWLSATWGEQIFVVFDRGQVWINSVNDLNKRSTAFSFGYTKRNMNKLQEAIERREKQVGK